MPGDVVVHFVRTLVIQKISRLIAEVMHSHFELLFIYTMNNRIGCIATTIIF